MLLYFLALRVREGFMHWGKVINSLLVNTVTYNSDCTTQRVGMSA